MTTKPILDLSTLEPERPTVLIDGQAYELAVPGDFGLAEQARLARLQKRVGALTGGEEVPPDEDIATLQAALTELVAMLLPDLPADVLGRLRDHHKLAIIRSFSTAAGVQESKMPPPPSRTGARSSRGSSASTVVGRRTG